MDAGENGGSVMLTCSILGSVCVVRGCVVESHTLITKGEKRQNKEDTTSRPFGNIQLLLEFRVITWRISK